MRAEQAALSPDDRTLLAGGGDGSVRFLDLVTGAVTLGSGRHDGGVERAAFSPDGRQAITAAEDGAHDRLGRRARRARARRSRATPGKITGLALTGDGSTLYSSGLDGRILIWDLAGDRRLGRPFAVGPATPSTRATR